jgi:hypothetical protein
MVRVLAVDRPELPAFEMPARFRHDVAYFMTPSDEKGAPKLAEGEYWIDPEDARHWLDEGVLHVYSPLDSTKQAEIEITDEQQEWLDWLVANQISRIRLEAR